MTITNLDQVTTDIEGTILFVAALYFYAKQHWISGTICTIFVFLAACHLTQ